MFGSLVPRAITRLVSVGTEKGPTPIGRYPLPDVGLTATEMLLPGKMGA